MWPAQPTDLGGSGEKGALQSAFWSPVALSPLEEFRSPTFLFKERRVSQAGVEDLAGLTPWDGQQKQGGKKRSLPADHLPETPAFCSHFRDISHLMGADVD